MTGTSNLKDEIEARRGEFLRIVSGHGLDNLNWVSALDQDDEPPLLTLSEMLALLSGVRPEYKLPLVVGLATQELDRQVMAAAADGLAPERWMLAVSFIRNSYAESEFIPHINAANEQGAFPWPPRCRSPHTPYGHEVEAALRAVGQAFDPELSRRFVVLQGLIAVAEDFEPRVLVGHLGCSYFAAAAGYRDVRGDPAGE